ncbi:hydrolase [Vibrio sp. qd031]|nr:hydrolase [Vibrio sp. qd031]
MKSVLLLCLTVASLFTLSGCDADTPSTPDDPSFGAMMSNPIQAYAKVTAERDFSFPADHQSHDDFRHEWWYLTANLVGESGREYGVQWTQFRFATFAEAEEQLRAESQPDIGWNSRHVYMAHSALTTQDAHYAAEKWSRSHSQLAGVDREPFAVYLDDWRWQSTSETLFPATLSVTHKRAGIKPHNDDFSFSLGLQSAAPFQLQGDRGYSIKSADGAVASYYYSQPYIDVEGEVIVDGVADKVSGKGWLDREWSSQILLDSQQGWDWFALRLSNDITLVLFQLRPNEEGDLFKSARIMDAKGNGFAINGEEIVLAPTDQTNAHPTQWQVSIPKHDINLMVTALNPNAAMTLSIPYWEGPVRFTGSHSGKGYLEMTGY